MASVVYPVVIAILQKCESHSMTTEEIMAEFAKTELGKKRTQKEIKDQVNGCLGGLQMGSAVVEYDEQDKCHVTLTEAGMAWRPKVKVERHVLTLAEKRERRRASSEKRRIERKAEAQQAA